MRIRSRLWKGLRAAGQTTAILFLGLGLTEVALRVLHRVSPLFIFPEAGYNRARPHPFAESYGFVHNSRGFKDVERRETKPPGVFRIIGIGDSFPYAVVPYEHGFLTRLERDLNADRGSIEVVNMGIPRIGVNDYFSLLVNEGLRYGPDLVLLCFYTGNDFKFPFETRPKSYVLAFLHYVFRVMPEYAHQVPAPAEYDDTRPTFSRQGYMQALGRKILQFHKTEPASLANLAKVTDYLAKIRELCARHDAALLVVIIPDELEVDPVVRAELLVTMEDVRPEDFDFGLLNAVLRAELERQGIAYLDLLPVLREEAKTAPVYKPRDTHWNLRGNRIAAREIAGALEPWIPSPPG